MLACPFTIRNELFSTYLGTHGYNTNHRVDEGAELFTFFILLSIHLLMMVLFDWHSVFESIAQGLGGRQRPLIYHGGLMCEQRVIDLLCHSLHHCLAFYVSSG